MSEEDMKVLELVQQQGGAPNVQCDGDVCLMCQG